MNRTLHLLVAILLLFCSELGAQTRTHVVLPHETLYRISLKYNVTVADLYRLNPGSREGIKAGQELRIPDQPTRKGTQGTSPTYHAVEEGETLYSISRKYGLSPSDLLRSNPSIRQDQLAIGAILVIPLKGGGVSPSTASASQGTSNAQGVKPVAGLKAYTVPAGETLYNLGRITGWTQEQLLQYNPQLKEGLKSGMIILVPDTNIANNRAVTTSAVQTPPGGMWAGLAPQTVVLALPFREDKVKRLVDYYEGFLLAIKELKDGGASVNLHVVDYTNDKLNEMDDAIRSIGVVDILIGGVSDESILRLHDVARQMGARYVIPFSSKSYRLSATAGRGEIFQINTPHEALYKIVAEKFVKTYRGAQVIIANAPEDGGSKASFLVTLRDYLSRGRIPFREISLGQAATPDYLIDLSRSHPRSVIVPSSASFQVAGQLMTSVSSVSDSLGVSNISLFGYPEWQTYTGRLAEKIYKSQSAFYTTFYVGTTEPTYQAFQKDFVSWFSHSVGNTYPRYSILGYDTARFFLMRRHSALVGSDVDSQQYRGIQSYFFFAPDLITPGVYLNNGVIFVNYSKDKRIFKN